MNAWIRLAAAGLVVAGLGACAGTHNLAVAESGVRIQQPGPVSTQVSSDAEYVAMVEHVARRRGVQVHWVHPPRRPAASTP